MFAEQVVDAVMDSEAEGCVAAGRTVEMDTEYLLVICQF